MELVNIINSTNLLNQFNIQQGDLLDANARNVNLNRMSTKFSRETQPGYNAVVDNTEYTLSPGAPVNGLDISFPATVVTFSIASTSANDTAAGTGARTLLVVGLDANYNKQTDTVTLNGQAPVNTNKTFIRINDLIVTGVGSTGSNEGNIHVSDSADTFTGGEPNTRIYESMAIGDNVSKTLVYTVPNGFLFAPTFLRFQSTATSTTTLELKFYRNIGLLENNVMALTGRYYVATGGAQIDLSTIGALKPKTDMYVRAVRATGNGSLILHANFEGILLRQY